MQKKKKQNPHIRTVPTCFGVVTMEKDEASMGEQKAFPFKFLFLKSIQHFEVKTAKY